MSTAGSAVSLPRRLLRWLRLPVKFQRGWEAWVSACLDSSRSGKRPHVREVAPGDAGCCREGAASSQPTAGARRRQAQPGVVRAPTGGTGGSGPAASVASAARRWLLRGSHPAALPAAGGSDPTGCPAPHAHLPPSLGAALASLAEFRRCPKSLPMWRYARTPVPPQHGIDPADELRGAALAEEFLAAPWLLPPRAPGLPWSGVHRLDELLALQSRPVGGHNRSVALLLFNRAFAELAQNSGGRPCSRPKLPRSKASSPLGSPAAAVPPPPPPPTHTCARSVLAGGAGRGAQLRDADVDAAGPGRLRGPQPALCRRGAPAGGAAAGTAGRVRWAGHAVTPRAATATPAPLTAGHPARPRAGWHPNAASAANSSKG